VKSVAIAILVSFLLACGTAMAHAELPVPITVNHEGVVSYLPSTVKKLNRGWYSVSVGFYYNDSDTAEFCNIRLDSKRYRYITDTCFEFDGTERQGGGMLVEILPGSIGEKLLLVIRH